MSDETVLKVKIATVTTLLMSMLSIAMVVLSTWVGTIGSDVGQHSKEIAAIKECSKNLESGMYRMEGKMDKLSDAFNAHVQRR